MDLQKDMKQPEPNSMLPDWEDFGDRGDKICLRCHYMNSCKCMWCSRCGQHTTRTYGHWTSICRMAKLETESEMLSSLIGTQHFCCPDNCELTNA